MSFIDDLGESVANMAKDVGEKARELSGTAKIHANIKAEEVRIQDLYYKLGKKYYEVYQNAPDTGVADIVDRIKAANEKIKEYREDLANAKESTPDVVVTDAPKEDDIVVEASEPSETSESSETSETVTEE